MTRLENAIALASRGLLIFPLSPRVKIPYKDDPWKEMMTTDEATIRKWFADRPDMNYAVCGGDKFFIVDLDRDASQEKDGVAEFMALQDAQDPTDWVYGETFTVRSPRGGEHLYVSTDTPVGTSGGTFARGVDIRGGRADSMGYVVGPGSYTDADPRRNTAAGEYVVVNDGPIGAAPPWVVLRTATSGLQRSKDDQPVAELDSELSLFKAREKIAQQTSWPTQGNNGDDATLAFCYALRDEGVSEDIAFDLMHEAIYEDGASWNERCDPPWEDADLARKLRNAYKYAKNQAGEKGGLALAGAADLGADAAEKAEKEAKLAKFAELVKNTFPGDSLIKRVLHLEMIVPQWMPMHGMIQVLAKRGVGKTICTLDMALRLGNDMPWHSEPMKQGLTAIYACGEDDVGFQEHYQAWLQVHKMHPAVDRFVTITAIPNLIDADDARNWAQYVQTLLPEGQRCVFFLDTWQRATSRGSQNDEEQMNIATDNAEGIARYLGGPIVCNFHPPKHNESTITGSMVIENKGTTILHMTKEGNQLDRKLKVLRIKGKGEGNEKKFAWNEVSWGALDEFGKPRTGIVPVCQSGTGMQETEESIQSKRDARFWYATLIAELIVEFNSHRVKPSGAEFTVADTARRVIEYMDKNNKDTQSWRSRFYSANDRSWSVQDIKKPRMEDALARHLKEMFGDGLPTKTDRRGDSVRLWAKSTTKSYFKLDGLDATDAPEESPEDLYGI